MPLLALGASHHRLGSERLARIATRMAAVSEALGADPAIDGVVGLATCNRFELYLDAAAFHPAVDAALRAVDAALGDDAPAVLDAVDIQAGEGAVEHVFRVACGLDSMVVGEPQISGQVRDALADAPAPTPALRRLFQDALTTAKAVASTTELGAIGRSVATIALDLVEVRHGPVRGRQVLVLGTGSYAGVVVAELTRRGCDDIRVYSRSGRADEFSLTHPVGPVAVDALPEALGTADVLVACSGSHDPLVTPDVLAAARADRSILPVVDLSTTGEIAPAVADMHLADVVDLDEVGAYAPATHAQALAAAQDVVDHAVAAYDHVEQGRTAAPAVTAMRAHVMQIIGHEVDQARRRYPEEVADAVARSLRRVSGALLHTPSVRAADLARSGDLQDYTRALHTLFGIDVEDESQP